MDPKFDYTLNMKFNLQYLASSYVLSNGIRKVEWIWFLLYDKYMAVLSFPRNLL